MVISIILAIMSFVYDRLLENAETRASWKSRFHMPDKLYYAWLSRSSAGWQFCSLGEVLELPVVITLIMISFLDRLRYHPQQKEISALVSSGLDEREQEGPVVALVNLR